MRVALVDRPVHEGFLDLAQWSDLRVMSQLGLVD